MVGGVVGVKGGALIGFAVGMDVGKFGAGACWVLLCDCCKHC
jgi:hypothetical protein